MELVDSRTGRTLLAATDFDGLSANFGGVAGIVQDAVSEAPIDRLARSYAHVLHGMAEDGPETGDGLTASPHPPDRTPRGGASTKEDIRRVIAPAESMR